MNWNSIAIVAVFIAVLIGGYFFFVPQDTEVVETVPTAATTTIDVNASTQAAIDFCEAEGGTVEVITAAEGVVHLCATADGGKVEVGQFMAANK